MADDDISGNASQINANAQAIQDALTETNKALDVTTKNIDKATKSAEKNLNMIQKTLPKVSKGFVDMKKKLTPIVSEMDALTESVQAASKHTNLLDKAIDRAMGGNQKQILASLIQFRKYGNAIKDAANQSVELANKMDEFSEAAKQANSSYKKLEDGLGSSRQKIQQNKKAIAELEDQIKSGGVETAKMTEELGKLKQAQIELNAAEQDTVAAMKAADEARTVAIRNLDLHATAFGENEKKVLELKEAYIQTIKEERRVSAEMKIMSGGMQAFTGHVQKFKNEKLFEYLEKIQSGALIAYGFSQIGSAIQDTSAIMASTAGIARTLGKDTKTSMGDFASSMWQAQEATSAMMFTSGELGMAFDKVSEAASRVRTSIRFDKEGQFSEKAIAGMTRAAAEFSKVTGVDMDQSVGMIEKRIKSFGMTSQEAVADINAMRISLQQMMIGTKNEVIAMDDMVRLIEDASDASRAYVVDTRLLTQALRGAATQSAHLGATQKQAKDVTQAVAKVFNDAPDFIKIPAGYDLLSQLTGGDGDAFLEKFDANTKRQLETIRDSVKAGELDKFSAAQAIMDATAGSEAGQEALMLRMNDSILKSGASATIIAETYGIENKATAAQLAKILKDTNKFKDALEKEEGHKISFASAMAKDVAVFEELMNGTESAADKMAKLQEKGLSAKDAAAYVDIRKKGLEFEKTARAEIKSLEGDDSETAVKRRAELEKEIYKQTTLAQAKFLDNALHPGKKLLNDLRGAMPKGTNLEISTELNATKLIAANYKNVQELAGAFGIKNKEHLEKLQKVYNNQESVTAGELEDMRRMESEASKKQLESITATATKFNEGILTGLKYVSISMLGGMGKWLVEKGIMDEKYLNAFGPITSAIVGVGATVAGLVLLWKGAGWLISNAVEKGVIAGMKASGGGSIYNDDNDGDADKKKKSSKGIFSKGKNFLKNNKKLVGGAALGGALALYSDKDKIASAYKERGLKGAALNALPAILSTLGGIGGGALGTMVAPGVGTVAGGIGGAAGGDALGRWIVDAVEAKDDSKEESATASASALGPMAMAGVGMIAGQQMPESQPQPQAPQFQASSFGTPTGVAGQQGGQMAFPSLQASASPTSFNPSDGKLTLEVTNWGDIMASFKKASSSAGLFG